MGNGRLVNFAFLFFFFLSALLAVTHSPRAEDAVSTNLEISLGPNDSVCTGKVFEVCANLTQNCPGEDMPLPGRKILFFVNPGNCGNNIATNAQDTVLTDANGNACATLTAPLTPGNYTIRVKFEGEAKPSGTQPPNSACNPNERVNLSASNDCKAIKVANNVGVPPVVTLPSDTIIRLCGPQLICLPVLIEDADCDIDTVTTNTGTYAGSQVNFDQIAKIRQLGGTVTQIGGGMPGKQLYLSTDFVAPVNTLSGVTVTLPNFVFANAVTLYGSFPSGIGPAQSADQLKGAPTDLTYTLPGSGGPDGGSGDGSVDFNPGNYCAVGFASDITACDGSSVDFVLYSNTNSGGNVNLLFYHNGLPVYSETRSLPSAGAGSGIGGVTYDLPDGIIFDEIKITCVSGQIELDAFAARVAASSTTKDICFSASGAGTHTIIVTATDKCGHVGADTVVVTIQMNQAPVANAGPDLVKSLCALGQICFPVTFTDPDNNIQTKQLLSGPGTLSGNQICYTPGSAGSSTFIIRVTDSCGLSDRDTVVVTVNLNSPPVAANPSPVTVFQCTATQICHTFTASDVNGGTLTWTKLSGVGTITTAGVFCFTPSGSGTYNAVVVVADSCGAKDTTSISYTITINSAPVAVNPTTPVNVFQCAATQICHQFTASDVNGGTLTWTKLAGSGTITTAGLWCFTPTTAGSYSVSAVVSDSCGKKDTTTLAYNISLNAPPVIALGNDTTVSQCTPAQICVSYTVSDPQGPAKLTEALVSGSGTIDTLNNKVCFTPASAGVHTIIVSVTDSCGATDRDTVNVTVNFDAIPQITCINTPISASLCAPGQVCQALTITPASATVTVVGGTYSSGQVCFNATTSGTYNVKVIASLPCGADTCDLTFNVTVGQAAQISCPGPQTKFLCSAASVCIPVSVMGPGASVSASPIGTYSAGNLCFNADTAGLYVITLIASTSCGSDTCSVSVTVDFNDSPVATNPTSPIDTFICAPANICYQFSASDANGGALTWTRLSGAGTVSSSGLWCFTASTSGSYSVVASVSDSCGAADTVTLTYDVLINLPPSVSLGNDSTIFVCSSQQVCVPVSATDVNGNISLVELVSGPGTYASGQVCFTPVAEGSYQFIVKVTDSCNAEDRDTINVTIDFNAAPVANAGADQTIFQCTSSMICWAAGATDADGNLTLVELVNGPGTFGGGQICFLPDSSWHYEFVLKATDACGAVDFDTVVIYYTLNSPPVANAGADQSVFQCTATQICWPAGCSDVDGNLTTCELESGPGSFNGSTICFTPSASGTYQFVMKATDACGLVDRDTVNISVTLNSQPVCSVPNDTTIFLCTAAKICLPVSGNDPNGNLEGCSIVSGPGTLSGGAWCYTPTSSQLVTVTIRCEDSCDAFCESTFSVNIKVNKAPTIDFATVGPYFLCTPAPVCIPYTVADPDAPQGRTVTLVSGPGTLDTANSQVCFTPSTSGSFTFIVQVLDACGAMDRDTITVGVTINAPPVANAGLDQSVFQCASGQICIPASCSDIDGNLLSCTLISGPGTYDGTNICFTPASSGSYQFIIRALDACLADDFDTVNVQVTLNETPSLALGNDTTIFQCQASQICLPYAVADANGLMGLTEVMVSGFGMLDTLNNSVCFTPASSGSYQFILSISDSCGATDADTIVVTVNLNSPVAIDCPGGPISVSLCAPDSVCQALSISSGATVSVTGGTYANGQVCFFAGTTGTYNVTVIASDACGADTCQLTFNVTVGQAASIVCPPASSVFRCAVGQVCTPISIMGTGATVTVSPIGTYAAGQICFNADSSGHYVLTVIASTSCGSDTCELVIDVDINQSPVAVNPASPVDTFMCNGAQICRQFTASDPDGGTLNWVRLSGSGTVSSSGLWCFTANTAGSYCVVAEVSDSCGAKDTVNACYNVTLNGPPIITLPADSGMFVCALGQRCFTYQTNDPNGNIVSETFTAKLGIGVFTNFTVDTALNQVCFTPTSGGNYTFIGTVTDACGLSDVDTVLFGIQENQTPIVNAGSDTTMFLCDPIQVCRTFSLIDNNVQSVVLLSGPGTIVGNQYCFTPSGSGMFTFIIKATDSCGASDQDTVKVTVTLNSDPVCSVPPDTSAFFQCSLTQVSLPVSATDADGNFDHCQILSGPGSLVGNMWVYTPTGDQTVKVKIMCVDDCGASCIDSFVVKFDINSAPVANAGKDSVFFLCGDAQICWTAGCSDPDNNLVSCEVLSPPGATINGNQVCLPAVFGTGNDKTYTVIVKATDFCGAVDLDTAIITANFNSNPVIDAPPDFTAFLDQVGQLCVDVDVSDPDNNLTGVVVSPIGTYSQSSGQICFNADTTGQYCLTITATDVCGKTAVDTICVTVEVDQCLHVQIEKVPGALQGHMTEVDIFLNGSGKPVGGFDFLIHYDNSALSVTSVVGGSLFNNCDWEYLTYRFGASGNCPGCPTGLLRIVALADMNDGAYHPSCYFDGQTGSLATLNILVSNDRTLECQFAPIRFFWLDCGDNVFTSVSGDTLWMSRNVFEYNLTNITDYTAPFPTYNGANNTCLVDVGPGKPQPLRCVDFTNGGVFIICADSIDARGDINLNDVAYEIGDAVMFTNYFISGLTAFGTHVEGSIAASDVNADGHALTVADLVYLIRVIVGDQQGIPKPDPEAKTADAEFQVLNDTLYITKADERIGAIFVMLEGDASVALGEATTAAGMELRYEYDGTNTRALIFTMKGKASVNDGAVLSVGGARVKTVEIGSFDGRIMTARISALPTTYSLSQNYPNPFNPKTTIQFALPVAGDWELVVYNILGQTVESFEGTAEAGYHKVEWDAGKYASGIYFYRLAAGGFSATKKMVLLK